MGEITVENIEFSTLSTDFSTTVFHSGKVGSVKTGGYIKKPTSFDKLPIFSTVVILLGKASFVQNFGLDSQSSGEVVCRGRTDEHMGRYAGNLQKKLKKGLILLAKGVIM